MSAAEMMEQIAEASPRFKAWLAGVLYLLTILTGAFVIFVRGRLFVTGDAATTVTNILAHEPLFLLGFAASLIRALCYVAVTLVLYDMFKDVNKSVSLLAALISLVAGAVGALSGLLRLASSVVLGVAQYLSVFDVQQLRAMALMFLKLRAQTASLSLVFFGFYCLLIAYLILTSTFLRTFSDGRSRPTFNVFRQKDQF